MVYRTPEVLVERMTNEDLDKAAAMIVRQSLLEDDG